MIPHREFTSADEMRALRNDNRELRFALAEANRRLAAYDEIAPALVEELKSAFNEECESRGTCPIDVRAKKKNTQLVAMRRSIIKSVCDRFPNASIADKARFFGVDRHTIYEAVRKG